ncbi:MAG: hypothetical protein RL215_1140 [Planctomycetota bacterium]|jgi:hypothetical protein
MVNRKAPDAGTPKANTFAAAACPPKRMELGRQSCHPAVSHQTLLRLVGTSDFRLPHVIDTKQDVPMQSSLNVFAAVSADGTPGD